MSNLPQPDETQLPWYRHRWPWILISIPAVSVLLGVFMITLSLRTNNSLVVDDYYKEGKAINLQLERDRNALEWGLAASFQVIDRDLVLQLDNNPEAHDGAGDVPAFSYADQVSLSWVHVTRAELDKQFKLEHAGAGRYVANDVANELPGEGRWNLLLEPDAEKRSWRLTSNGSISAGDANVQLKAHFSR